jgi:chitodextrinase
VSWGASFDANGDTITYEVEYGVNNTPGWTSAGTTTSTSRTLSGLNPDTTYVVRVRARDNFTPQAYSSWNEKDPAFTTLANIAPTIPGTITILGITRTGATVSWGASFDANGDTITYEVEYGVNNTPGWTSAGTTTSTSRALSGLNPDTTYVVRVRARDNFNPPAYSSWNEKDPAFTTPPINRAPSTPGTITISGVTRTSATVSWSASSDLDDDPITYEVEYGINNTPGWTSAGTTSSTSVTLTGLTPDTTYVVRVRARDNFSSPAYSSWNEKDPAFTTLANNAPTQPGTITPSNVTSNSASVAWIASTDSDGDIITYEVEYGVNNTLFWTSAGTTTSTSKSLTGLQPETTYVVRVRATDGRGGVSTWRELDPTFTTLPVHGIAQAYWLPRPPVTVRQGTIVTLRAEAAGFDPGTDFLFRIYEDDPDGNDVVTNLTGKVYTTNGTFYADAQWAAKWCDDGFGQGDPEYYFVASSGNISKDSGTSTSEELVVERRNAWHAVQTVETLPITSGSSTVNLAFSVDDLPTGVQLAQVAFFWDINLQNYEDDDVELTFFGPGWQKNRVVRLVQSNRVGVQSFDRDSFSDGFLASAGNWGVRVENLSAGEGPVTINKLDVLITHFSTLTTHPLPPSPDGDNKVVVLVHGWNPKGLNVEQHYDEKWIDLTNAINTNMQSTPGWDLALYNWIEDAATGPTSEDLYVTGIANAVASRAAGVSHALYLGDQVKARYPNLAKAHLIAHSAGNWVARGAARYLRQQFPNAEIQVTSLDAYIPGPAVYVHPSIRGIYDSSVLSSLPPNQPIFEELGRGAWKPAVLDNYFVFDDPTDYKYLENTLLFNASATSPPLHNAGWQPSVFLNAGDWQTGDNAPLYDRDSMDNHGGPVLWYARTVEVCNAGNSPILNGAGFAASLMFTEPRAHIDSITPSTAQPPADSITFQGSGTVNGGSVTAWEWSSSVDGILNTSAGFSKSSRELTVGAHVISFRIRDNQGNWSDSVSANLTVNNATPTATMSGVPGTPVLAGTMLNLALGGQDNDESGQSIVAGELSVLGSVVATPPPGSYTFTVPAQAGDYSIGYRVRDDEGSWSPLIVQSITVQPPPSITTTCPLPAGAVGVAYSQTLAATGGTTPYNWTISNGVLPPGLNLDPGTGIITGTPNVAGTYDFTIRCTSANSQYSEKVCNLTVNLGIAPTIATICPLPTGTVGTDYNQTLAASGGTAPYTWTISSGALPPGLNLNSATGIISGTPGTADTYNFIIRCTGANSSYSEIGCSVTIDSPITRVIGLSGDLDFGVVPTNTVGTRTLTIANSGNSMLNVSNITYPLGFSGAWSGAIASGSSTNVTVTFAPTALTSYGQTVMVISDATSGTASLQISGTGVIRTLPRLSGTALSNGVCRFMLNGIDGEVFTIQVSSNLVNWLFLSTHTIPAGGTVPIVDSTMLNQPRRFYRAVPWVPVEISIPAASGVVTWPFVISNGIVFQTVTTTTLTGGRAAYNFTIQDAGNYVVRGIVNALDIGENSFFINIDAEPQSGSYMVWDIPPTFGVFESRTVSWFGNGPPSQFVPKVFTLGAGQHQLIIRGREAHAYLQSLTIAPYP